jgi:hypothetical protein
MIIMAQLKNCRVAENHGKGNICFPFSGTLKDVNGAVLSDGPCPFLYLDGFTIITNEQYDGLMTIVKDSIAVVESAVGALDDAEAWVKSLEVSDVNTESKL